MKTTRWGFVVAFATLLVAAVAQAQVEFYIVDKSQHFIQTSAAGATADPTAPFSFSAEINGTAIGGITNHAFTPPGGSPTNIPVDTNNPTTQWKYRQNFSNQGLLDGAFANGAFSLDVATATGISLNLGGTANVNLYPTVTPEILGVTNGAFWNGSGQLVVNPSLGTTLTFSTFTQYASSASGQVGGHIGAFLYSTNVSFTDINTEAFTINSDPAYNTFTIPASGGSALVSGGIYKFEMEFNILTGLDTVSLSGATGVAIFTKSLQFEVIAVPEPATYAEIFGVMALVGAIFHRRRRLV